MYIPISYPQVIQEIIPHVRKLGTCIQRDPHGVQYPLSDIFTSITPSTVQDVWKSGQVISSQRYDSESSIVPEDSFRWQFNLQQSHQQSSVSWSPQGKFLSVSPTTFDTTGFQRRYILTSLVMSNNS